MKNVRNFLLALGLVPMLLRAQSEAEHTSIDTALFRYQMGAPQLLVHPGVVPLLLNGYNLGNIAVRDSESGFKTGLGLGEMITSRRAQVELEHKKYKEEGIEEKIKAVQEKVFVTLPSAVTPGAATGKQETPQQPLPPKIEWKPFLACLKHVQPTLKRILSRINEESGEWEIFAKRSQGFPCGEHLGTWRLPALSLLDTYKSVSALLARDLAQSQTIFASMILAYHESAPRECRTLGLWALTVQRIQSLHPQAPVVQNLEELSLRLKEALKPEPVVIPVGDSEVISQSTSHEALTTEPLQVALDFLKKAEL